jgi:hypothetical protein
VALRTETGSLAPGASCQETAAAGPTGEIGGRPPSTRLMKPIRVSLAPVTVVVGIALIGNGIDGSIGAGVALVAVVVIGFLVALVLVDDETTSVGRRRTKKTLRHRVLLAADVRRRRRAAKKLGHERRKEAERDFLRHRDRRRKRAKDL